MSPSPQRLLDRPLRRDRLVRLWTVVLAAVALSHVPRYVEWGGGFNPSRAGELVGVLLPLGALTWLLLVLLPAVLRRGLRHRRARWRPGHGLRDAGRWWPGAGPARRRAPQWDASTDRYAPYPADAPAGVWRPGAPPAFRTLTVHPLQVTAGQPVTVAWDAPDAEHVAVGELTGLPPRGSTVLVPRGSGPVSVTAVNSHGTSAGETAPVALQAPARIDLSCVGSPPAVPRPAPPLSTEVVRSRLDLVLDRQRARRTAVRPVAPGATLPPASPSTARHDGAAS